MKRTLPFAITSMAILLTILTVQSCKHEVSYIDDYVYTKDDKFVSIDEANIIATNINKSGEVKYSVDKAHLKSSKYSGKREISNSITISDKQNTPYFYVYNYSSGGFAIMSADRRLLPIQAYVDNGYFKKDSLPIGIIRWLDINAQVIKDLRKSNAKQDESVAQVYNAMLCPVDPLSSTIKAGMSSDNCTPRIISSRTVGPLLNTTWGQGCGYNTYCPNTNNAGYCYHANTGCATTAIAQIMAYWKYPASYNWNDMSLTYGNEAVAKLMGDIFPHVIDSYTDTKSSCSNDWNIRRTFLDFGYSSASLEGNVNGWTENGGYNYKDVISNLDYKKPVILGAYTNSTGILGFEFPSGSGHVWVCDGYISTQYTTYSSLMFDMNWGWQGKYNGWYAFNNWSNPNGNYNYGVDIIFNIHP